ncbi:MAG: four helix bundle protein [Bacteroidetes bacterium]|nr:four helix bundle protein [Bacteroidota bacterium]
MSINTDNIIVKKSYAFALEIIKLYKYLIEQKEFVLSKQIMRSGTSIGANIHEGVVSESKKDFIHKLNIALKESNETIYWLNLLKDSEYISEDYFSNLIGNCIEIKKILNSIILTTKQRYLN